MSLVVRDSTHTSRRTRIFLTEFLNRKLFQSFIEISFISVKILRIDILSYDRSSEFGVLHQTSFTPSNCFFSLN